MTIKTVTEAGFYNGKFLKAGASYDDGLDLSALTKEQLLAEAEKRQLPVAVGSTKAEIIKVLSA